jgi:hypothetical protein
MRRWFSPPVQGAPTTATNPTTPTRGSATVGPVDVLTPTTSRSWFYGALSGPLYEPLSRQLVGCPPADPYPQKGVLHANQAARHPC